MMTLDLYHFDQSTCSQKVRLCLGEKNLSYNSVHVDLRRRVHLEDWYLEINPNGVVPALVHDGAAILDSSVICEYLDEVFPDPTLSFSDPRQRAHMRAWMRFLEEVPTTAIRVPTFNRIFKTAARDTSEDRFQKWTGKMPLRKHFYRKMTKDGFDQQTVDESLDRLRLTLNRAEKHLSDHDFLAGDRYSIADIVLLPTIVRMEDLGMASEWDQLPRFADWYDRVCQRPSFEKAYYKGTRLEGASEWAAVETA